MANSKLQMPANYMALNESEMSCVEGGGIISQVCYAFGRMFRSTYYDKWESESKTLEQSHGAVVSKKNGVYTYSDGYTPVSYTHLARTVWQHRSVRISETPCFRRKSIS